MKIDRVRIQLSRRYRQLRDIWKNESHHGIIQRARTVLAQWLIPKDVEMPVLVTDVLAADLTRPCSILTAKPSSSQPLLVNWVMTPPGHGSGGHTTLFRIIRFLEAHGYINRIYFYDVYRGDYQYYESIVRNSYGFDGPVASLNDRMKDAHAVVATSWPTAYPVFNSPCDGKRFYFVQDFEPYFHPVSTSSVLAENTYRMGFHAITAGRWLTEKLRSEFCMEADYFEFGCDTTCYQRHQSSQRSSVVFYARPDAARRGYELGLMAIEVFANRRPEIEIHFYGNKMGKLPFAFVDHGHVTPEQLNEIYNRCYAGLSLSLTNVSLVPHEMLAAGCIPVVNDALHNKMVLNNPFVRYASSNPHALAKELETIVLMDDFDSLSQAAATSVKSTTWDAAGATVDAIFRQALSV